MFRSVDSGSNWRAANDGLTARVFRTIQPDPHDRDAILAGSEPARAFRSVDGGASWREIASISGLAGVEEWFLPYSPRAGALRNFYAPPGRTGALYGSVEVGGLLHSDDSGASWRVIAVDPGPRVHDDVHFVTGDPRDPDLLYVALGGALVDRTHPRWAGEPRRIGGVARSDDAGRSWRKLRSEYTRALMIPSAAPDLLLAGPSHRTGEGGWIVVSSNRGESWERADAGIETPMPDMVERFEEAPDSSIWALCSGGRLLRSDPGEWRWSSPLAIDGESPIVESISFVDELARV
jgi:photosystem II stability/assembly factor-like uncharacterized protein